MSTPKAYYHQLRQQCGTNLVDRWANRPDDRKRFMETIASKYGIAVSEQLEQQNQREADMSSRDQQLKGYRDLLEASWRGKKTVNWKQIDFGVLPTVTLYPNTLTVPDSNAHLIIFDETVFTLIYLVAKALCGYLLQPSDTLDTKTVLKIEDIEKTMEETPAGVGRFTEAMIAFHVMKRATQARPYLVDAPIMNYSAWLTDSAIVSLMVTGTLTALLDDKADSPPQQKQGFMGRLFGRKPKAEPQTNTDTKAVTKLEPLTICENVKVTQRVPIEADFREASYALSTGLVVEALSKRHDWSSTLAGIEMLLGIQRIHAEIDGHDADVIMKQYRTARSMMLSVLPEGSAEQVMPLLDTIQAITEHMWERGRQTFYRFAQQPPSPRNN